MLMRRGRRLRFGTRRGQVAVLRPAQRPGPHPTVVLLHGGFWRWPYNRWLMWLLVRDVHARGWCSLNVGYRRLGRLGGGGGWPATFDDVRTAVDLVASQTDLVDLDRIALVGHSAGAQLALWAAHEVSFRPVGIVSMSGITDLGPGWADGDDSITALIADAPQDRRLELTSPRQRLPLGVPVVCVHGADDTTVEPDRSRDFVDAATAAGDDATLVEVPGEGHRRALLPGSGIWAAAVAALDAWFEVSRIAQDGK